SHDCASAASAALRRASRAGLSDAARALVESISDDCGPDDVIQSEGADAGLGEERGGGGGVGERVGTATTAGSRNLNGTILAVRLRSLAQVSSPIRCAALLMRDALAHQIAGEYAEALVAVADAASLFPLVAALPRRLPKSREQEAPQGARDTSARSASS